MQGSKNVIQHRSLAYNTSSGTQFSWKLAAQATALAAAFLFVAALVCGAV